jgi:release factor glutamine methyltransferase
MTNRNINVYTLIKPEIIKLRKVGIKTAILDCRLLLSKSLGRKLTLYNHENVNISKNEVEHFKTLIVQRLSGKPVSRIINKRDFWKKEFKLNEETLDPRPDSETLIESVLEHYRDKLQALKILDLGSGSGCLGLSLLDEYHNSKVSFFDISEKSLEIVKINSLNFGFSDRSKFVHLDWRDRDWDLNLIKIENENKFDILISNPPYIPAGEIKKLQKEVREYDPFIALNGGKDGLNAYKLIIPKLRNILKKNGKIFFEIGKGQEKLISSIAMEYGLLPIEYKKDFSGINRVIVFIIK